VSGKVGKSRRDGSQTIPAAGGGCRVTRPAQNRVYYSSLSCQAKTRPDSVSLPPLAGNAASNPEAGDVSSDEIDMKPGDEKTGGSDSRVLPPVEVTIRGPKRIARTNITRRPAGASKKSPAAIGRGASGMVLDRVPTSHAEKLASLMTLNFQEFDDVSLLAA
jgi:hypothetical protein